MERDKQISLEEIKAKAKQYWERTKDETNPYNLSALYKRAIDLTYLAERLERELDNLDFDTEETSH